LGKLKDIEQDCTRKQNAVSSAGHSRLLHVKKDYVANKQTQLLAKSEEAW